MTPRRRTIADAERVLDADIKHYRSEAARLMMAAQECNAKAEALESARFRLDEPVDENEPTLPGDEPLPEEPAS